MRPSLLVGILFVAVALAGAARAQYDPDSYGKFDLSARVETDTSRVPAVHFRITIPYRRLTFKKHDDIYESRVRITAYLKNPKSERTTGDVWEERVVASSYQETALRNQTATFGGELLALPGRYRLQVQIDVLGTSNRYLGETRVEIPKLKDQDFFLGGLEFWQLGTGATLPTTGGPVWLGSLGLDPTIEPNTSRIYDDETGPPRVTFVVYHFGSVRRFQVGYRLVDAEGRTRLYGRQEFPGPGTRTRLYLDIDFDRFSPGRYRLELAASPLPEGDHGRLSEYLLIRTNRQSWGSDYLNTIEQVKYIASEDELEKLRNTPPSRRKEAWDEFWAKRDPNPRTQENEAKVEYFERIRYADDHFGTRSLAGWKTDRGRVYIVEGPPDETEERGDSVLSPAELLWYYYASRRVYVFRDDLGIGDYRLDYVDTY